MKTLTQTEEFVLSIFKRYGSCPTMLELAKAARMDKESVRRVMWSLVEKKYVKVNNKLNTKKFYVGKK